MNNGCERLTGDYETDRKQLEQLLRVADSFDLIARKIEIGGRKATLFFVDGFIKDEVMEKFWNTSCP